MNRSCVRSVQGRSIVLLTNEPQGAPRVAFFHLVPMPAFECSVASSALVSLVIEWNAPAADEPMDLSPMLQRRHDEFKLLIQSRFPSRRIPNVYPG
jgi:hypothetical protein